jgi:SOS-response transcriptional repressor LexA
MTNESTAKTVRPTKKQRDILTYIEGFIGEHGYSPSYREIMNGLNYTSVATVSLHVNSLIRRGHLRKRDRSARSLEVVASKTSQQPTATSMQPEHEAWLVKKIETMFSELEISPAGQVMETTFADMAVLVNALRALGLEVAARSCMPRLAALQARVVPDTGSDTASASEEM